MTTREPDPFDPLSRLKDGTAEELGALRGAAALDRTYGIQVERPDDLIEVILEGSEQRVTDLLAAVADGKGPEALSPDVLGSAEVKAAAYQRFLKDVTTSTFTSGHSTLLDRFGFLDDPTRYPEIADALEKALEHYILEATGTTMSVENIEIGLSYYSKVVDAAGDRFSPNGLKKIAKNCLPKAIASGQDANIILDIKGAFGLSDEDMTGPEIEGAFIERLELAAQNTNASTARDTMTDLVVLAKICVVDKERVFEIISTWLLGYLPQEGAPFNLEAFKGELLESDFGGKFYRGGKERTVRYCEELGLPHGFDLTTPEWQDIGRKMIEREDVKGLHSAVALCFLFGFPEDEIPEEIRATASYAQLKRYFGKTQE